MTGVVPVNAMPRTRRSVTDLVGGRPGKEPRPSLQSGRLFAPGTAARRQNPRLAVTEYGEPHISRLGHGEPMRGNVGSARTPRSPSRRTPAAGPHRAGRHRCGAILRRTGIGGATTAPAPPVTDRGTGESCRRSSLPHPRSTRGSPTWPDPANYPSTITHRQHNARSPIIAVGTSGAHFSEPVRTSRRDISSASCRLPNVRGSINPITSNNATSRHPTAPRFTPLIRRPKMAVIHLPRKQHRALNVRMAPR